MNLVDQIARVIDKEGAFAVAFDSTGHDAKMHPHTTRQKYWQATYELMAVEILKRVRLYTHNEIRQHLIDFEKSGWLRLGVPVDDPNFKELANKIIEEKYPLREPAHR